ncbi:MAG: helix-turn-helix domain-containing protein [Candidatus Micrarchaeia archaeon]
MDEMEELLTPQEIAKLLKVKLRFVYHLTSSGRIPYVKVGRFLRFRPEDIRRWLSEKTHYSILLNQKEVKA